MAAIFFLDLNKLRADKTEKLLRHWSHVSLIPICGEEPTASIPLLILQLKLAIKCC